jgi:D-alanyl-D-alanine-carboxypeptidase/D-alanyl-D-alanine-endopeptidase
MKGWMPLLILMSVGLHSQSFERATFQIDSIAKRQANKFFNRAVVAGIYYQKSDSIISRGRINSLGRKADAEDVFQIGTVSKVFTTLMLAKEIQAGNLSLEDSVKPYLTNRKKDKFDSVSLYHLATNTSGMPNVSMVIHVPSNLAGVGYGTLKNMLWLTPANAHWLLKLGPWQAIFMPPLPYYSMYGGAALKMDLNNTSLKKYGQWKNSNVGMGVLGNILTEEKGLSYEEMLQKEICEPLGLEATSTKPKNLPKGKYATPHNMFGIRTIRTQFPKNGMEGAGDIKMSSRDMMKFLRLQLKKDGPLGAAAYIQQQTYFVDESGDNPGLAMGLGWIKLQRPNQPEILWIRGQVKGTSAFIGFIPEKQIGLFLMANNNHPNKLSKAGLWWLKNQ